MDSLFKWVGVSLLDVTRDSSGEIVRVSWKEAAEATLPDDATIEDSYSRDRLLMALEQDHVETGRVKPGSKEVRRE